MKRDEAILKAIYREILSLPSLMKGYTKDRFLKSEKTQKAVCMTLLNIGELVKGLSGEIKKNYNMVQWKEIAGMRDIVAHKYQYVNMERIWFTAKKDIPDFKKQVSFIIEEIQARE